jgi:hypothetical protein
MKIDMALVVSVMSLAVATADFFSSRYRNRKLEARETLIEARESGLEKRVEELKKEFSSRSSVRRRDITVDTLHT